MLYARSPVNDMPDESKVKSEDSAKKSKKPAKRKAPRAKRRTRTATKEKVNKSDFVRKQPLSMGPSEVVEKAKELGFKLTGGYVSTIRSKAKKGKGSRGAPVAERGAATRKKGKPPEKAQRVLDLKAQHPDWTMARIVKEVGCTPTYAYKVIRDAGNSRGRKTTAVARLRPSTDQDRAAFYRFLKREGVDEVQKLVAEYAFIQSA
jgi:hypothetical protein